MGHRSYLYLNKKEKNFYAFEANNSVPFFWLTLIDSKTLNFTTSKWKEFEKYSNNHTKSEFEKYELDKSFTFKIDFHKFQKNHVKGIKFITNHHPKIINLYTDFIETLKYHFNEHDILEIEIDQISAFYNSLDEYITTLNDEINAIEKNKPENISFLNTYDLIASGCGFESVNLKSFSKLPSYKQAYKNRRAIPVKKQYSANKGSLILAIIILLICPIFTFIIYRGYTKDGFSFVVILIGIFNLLFYLYPIWEIIAQIKYRINTKRNET